VKTTVNQGQLKTVIIRLHSNWLSNTASNTTQTQNLYLIYI